MFLFKEGETFCKLNLCVRMAKLSSVDKGLALSRKFKESCEKSQYFPHRKTF